MSGRDEEPIRDFPLCSKCYNITDPQFWRGVTGGASITYFDCIGYKDITKPRVIYGSSNDAPKAILEEVNQVTSISCGNCGTNVDETLFEKIMEMGRKLSVREG